ncbi:MAG TPA: hypothetical protein VLA26_06715 [Gammaproteobacteria bacterium]|nr:hypothetical protein [Gammaproteobacteria bacterium]
MIAGKAFLSLVVLIALVVTMAAPLILAILWIRDWKQRQLW